VPSVEELLPDSRTAIGQATGAVSRTVSALGSFAIILFLGLVFAASPGPYVRGLLALVPERREARTREVLEAVTNTLRWWLVGRLISMTVIGVATGVGLALLGVPLAFLLGLIAALLSFIPNVGPILSAVPAVLLALVDGPRQALWVVLLYLGIQAVESWVLDPILDRKTVYLPPAVTVLTQLVLAIVAGLLGAALAAPLAAAGVVLVTMLYVQDVLGRDVPVPGH
jgi:predicted PurR-regulated permease PerM